ncbi:hypothetical protein HOY80DRAFT_1053604 [Tuber brumale]|nr:hypothetical protein HOY80DRAFT_1053604 [Tuber brumale]
MASEDFEDCIVPKYPKLKTIIVWGCFKGGQKEPLAFWNKDLWGKTVKSVSFSTNILSSFYEFWLQQLWKP